MKRRCAIAYAASVFLPTHASASANPPLLTISGGIHRANNPANQTYEFSDAEFLALPQSSITTATPWTASSVFVGPTLMDVMAVVGVTAGTLTFRALDDYAGSIPWEDLVRYGVILAHSQNGERLNIKRWGPLWTIYPRDRYPEALTGPIAESRFIWQVNRIEVSR